MPTQPPIPAIAESQEKILRNVGWQLAQIDNLAQRLGNGPFIAPDTRPSLGNLVGLMRVFNSLCSDTGAANDRPWNWQGVEEWQQMAGFKSDKTCREAIKVLKSLGLIDVKDEWAGNNKRRLHVRIVWERFLDDEITQDEEDLKLWTARHTRRKNQKRQGKLFGSHYRTYSVATTGPIRCALPNASICDPHIYPPIHPQDGGEGGEVGSSKAEGTSEHETDESEMGPVSQTAPDAGKHSAGSGLRVLRMGSAADHQRRQRDVTGHNGLGTRQRQLCGSLSDVGRDAAREGAVLARHRDGDSVPPAQKRLHQPDAVLPAPVAADGNQSTASTGVHGVTAEEFTTEARRHGEESCQSITQNPTMIFTQRGTRTSNPISVATSALSVSVTGTSTTKTIVAPTATEPAHSTIEAAAEFTTNQEPRTMNGPASVPPCLRGESSGPSTLNHQPSTLRSLATRLRRLGEGMGSPESVLRASQAAGYSVEQIDQIVTWYERQARTDAKNKTWWPYTLGQLATRLKDEQARLDGCTPAQGRWAGGKCGIWLSLGQEGPGPRGKGLGPDTGMVVPTKEQAAALEQQERVRSLSRRDGIELLRITAESPGDLQQRAREALRWAEAGGWPKSALVTPKGLCRLLGEILQRGERDERSEVRGESQRGTR